jgi:Sigma-70, region 4
VTLEQALDQLTPKQRTVLVLRYYEDLTETETASVLHIGLGALKSMHRQALSGLRVLSPGMVSLIGDGHECSNCDQKVIRQAVRPSVPRARLRGR